MAFRAGFEPATYGLEGHFKPFSQTRGDTFKQLELQ